MMKIKNPKEVEEEFKKIADNLGLGIDKNILSSIVILNSIGFKTRQSCEGHLKSFNTSPWIDLIWDEEDNHEYYQQSLKYFYQTLFQDLKEFYILRPKNYDQMITCSKFNEPVLIIRLSQFENLKCFKGQRREKLKNYLAEMNEFCEFLNKKYQLNY